MGVIRRTFLQVVYFTILLFIVGSCSSKDDPLPDRWEGLQHDFLLTGEWSLAGKDPNNDLPGKMTLSADGSGEYVADEKTGTLKWGNDNHLLVFELDNGFLSESNYTVSGATLTLDGKHTYVLNIPILGEWFLNSAGDERTAPSFAYHFLPSGKADYKYFDGNGFLRSVYQLDWQRMENGKILLKKDGQRRDLSYQMNKEVLTIADEGHFVGQNKWDFYGNWVSEYTEKGKITNKYYPYSTLQMLVNNGKNHILIDYVTEDGYKRNAEYLWQKYSDDYLYLYFDVDEKMLYYRYRYDPSDREIYLEISEEEDFNQYTGYSKSDNSIIVS